MFITAAVCLFLLLSCGRADTLFDILSESVIGDTSLSVGKIIRYGRYYGDGISEDTLCEILGFDEKSGIGDKIEDFASFSSVRGEYSELTVVRVYGSGDAVDIEDSLIERISLARAALGEGEIKGNAKNGVVKRYGNTVFLAMAPVDSTAAKEIEKRIR